MSKYYDALNRNSLDAEQATLRESSRATDITKTQRLSAAPREIVARSDSFAVLSPSLSRQSSGPPAPQKVSQGMATQQAIRRLCERIAPRAVVERSCRVAVAGCRAGDGASSVAAALAFDLS